MMIRLVIAIVIGVIIGLKACDYVDKMEEENNKELEDTMVYEELN